MSLWSSCHNEHNSEALIWASSWLNVSLKASWNTYLYVNLYQHLHPNDSPPTQHILNFLLDSLSIFLIFLWTTATSSSTRCYITNNFPFISLNSVFSFCFAFSCLSSSSPFFKASSFSLFYFSTNRNTLSSFFFCSIKDSKPFVKSCFTRHFGFPKTDRSKSQNIIK